MVSLLFLIITAPEKRCDLIEVNHHVCDCKVRWSQVIYWKWDKEYGRYDVADFRLTDDYPVLTKRGWVDKGVVAPSFKETWTTIDPETANQRLRLPWDREKLR